MIEFYCNILYNTMNFGSQSAEYFLANQLLEGCKMAVIEKFLGKQVKIPEDRKYDATRGLWANLEDQIICFGLTEPALVLSGGINDLDWLVCEGTSVNQGQDVVFMITAKILYIQSPFAGIIVFNQLVKQSPSLALQDPYRAGWLFKLQLAAGKVAAWQSLATPHEYIQRLKNTEGFKNPEGLQGGVSGICKAVYSGFRDQKI